MQHPITGNTYQVTPHTDFDYLTAGIVYRATPSYCRGAISQVRLDREDETSGTFINRWQWHKLAEYGEVVAHPNRPR